MIILGAGMSGCLAGILNPQAEIYEAQESAPVNHNAVLRFRDNTISQITGIPFKQVAVNKGIFLYGHFHEPNIITANLYSQKVLGIIADRSIWNLEPVQRFIAPVNFQSQLFEIIAKRVILGHKVEDPKELYPPCISTIPMPTLMKILQINHNIDFKYQSIHTKRYTIDDCNVYQTIYYPGDETSVYRATITGNQLILEMVPKEKPDVDLEYILASFGINIHNMGIEVDTTTKINNQKYGKIAAIDDTDRRQLLYSFTKAFGIYSAGRFAIWKNVLMDDVLFDLYAIRDMQAKDNYEHHRRM